MSILDQCAESISDRLWLVTNRDGSHEICTESTRGGRSGFSPPCDLTYGEVLCEFMKSRDRCEALWLRFYAEMLKGIHRVGHGWGRLLTGAYFVARGKAYKAYVGTHHTGPFLGFGGDRYRITLNTEVIESNNVWFIAVVPPHLRGILRDNAMMEAM